MFIRRTNQPTNQHDPELCARAELFATARLWDVDAYERAWADDGVGAFFAVIRAIGSETPAL